MTTQQSVRQVARNLGIAESSLSRWVRESKEWTTVKWQGDLSADEHQELLQLRRQVKQSPKGMDREPQAGNLPDAATGVGGEATSEAS